MLRVKEICREKGLTVAIIAKRMGIMPPALSRIINGSNTTTDTLNKIANALGVTIQELFEKPIQELPPPTDLINCPYCGRKIKVSKE